MPKRAGVRARGILAAAMTDRSRLEFLLELSHELRTPAGVIDGYLSLARQGELRVEDALDVAAIKSRELCALLDDLLANAQRALENKEDAMGSVGVKQGRARPRRRAFTGKVVPSAAGERRDHLARAARDALAFAVGVHPRDLGALTLSTVLRLTGELERREDRRRVAEERVRKDAG